MLIDELFQDKDGNWWIKFDAFAISEGLITRKATSEEYTLWNWYKDARAWAARWKRAAKERRRSDEYKTDMAVKALTYLAERDELQQSLATATAELHEARSAERELREQVAQLQKALNYTIEECRQAIGRLEADTLIDTDENVMCAYAAFDDIVAVAGRALAAAAPEGEGECS